MTDEQIAAYEALRLALRQVEESVSAVLSAAVRVWHIIQVAIVDTVRAFLRVWRQWRVAHRIPRHYRNTIARRKVRRYYARLA